MLYESWVDVYSDGKRIVSEGDTDSCQDFLESLREKISSEDAEQLDEKSVSALDEFTSKFALDPVHLLANAVEIVKGATELLGKAIKIMFQNLNMQGGKSSEDESEKDENRSLDNNELTLETEREVKTTSPKTSQNLLYFKASSSNDDGLYESYNKRVAERAEKSKESKLYEQSNEAAFAPENATYGAYYY